MMKKTLLFAFGIAFVAGMSSCSEKFDVAAPYKPVTVVTCFLDIADTAHYIRIEKGFMDNNKSALDMSQVADSSYWADLDVKVKEMIPANPVPVNVFTLTRVNMDDEGYPKAANGSFFTTPNYAYKFKQTLNPTHRYRLVITNNQTHEVDSAETAIIDTAESRFSVTEFLDPTIRLSKKDAGGKFFLSGNIVAGTGDSLEAPAGVKVLECAMRFYYRDSFASGQKVSHELFWGDMPASVSFPTNTNFNLSVLNSSFYDFFQENIPAVDDINAQFRKMDSITIYVYAGSRDYAVYKSVVGAQTSSLTGGEIKPNYSNIKGGVVLGLYTTRASKTGRGFHLQVSPTLDSLKADPRTARINFVKP